MLHGTGSTCSLGRENIAYSIYLFILLSSLVQTMFTYSTQNTVWRTGVNILLKEGTVLFRDMRVHRSIKIFSTTGSILYNWSSSNLEKNFKDLPAQGCNVRKVYCSLVYSAYILKPVLSGRNL